MLYPLSYEGITDNPTSIKYFKFQSRYFNWFKVVLVDEYPKKNDRLKLCQF
jgi:hypothetical protein